MLVPPILAIVKPDVFLPLLIVTTMTFAPSILVTLPLDVYTQPRSATITTSVLPMHAMKKQEIVLILLSIATIIMPAP
jgi:hypothetical protein